MALILDVSKLTQSAAMKPTAHDNCIVLDLGAGPFPRDIEVRLPDDDGARQNALWDGSLNLAVNDEVLCFEYSGISAWRIMAMGGNDGGAGKARVSEVWESDFGDPALQSDADGNIGIGTIGPDAKLDILATAGAQLRLTFENEVKFANFTLDTNHDLTIKPSSTGQVKIQPTTDSIDFFQILDADGGIPVFNVDSSNERVGIGTAGPSAALEVFSTTQNQLRIAFGTTKYAEFSFDTSHLLTIDTTSVGHILLNATVRIVDEILREGDFDTKIGLADDKISLTAGGLLMFEAIEVAGQDTLDLGDVAGGGDVDINFNSGQMFLQGSSGRLGLNDVAPSFIIDAVTNTNGAERISLVNSNAGASAQALLQISNDDSKSYQAGVTSSGNTAPLVGSGKVFFQANATDLIIRSVLTGGFILFAGGATGTTELVKILDGTPRMAIGAGAFEGNEMTDPGAGAANTYRLFAEDNGAGKTRLMVRFSSGAAVQIAIQP